MLTDGVLGTQHLRVTLRGAGRLPRPQPHASQSSPPPRRLCPVWFRSEPWCHPYTLSGPRLTWLHTALEPRPDAWRWQPSRGARLCETSSSSLYPGPAGRASGHCGTGRGAGRVCPGRSTWGWDLLDHLGSSRRRRSRGPVCGVKPRGPSKVLVLFAALRIKGKAGGVSGPSLPLCAPGAGRPAGLNSGGPCPRDGLGAGGGVGGACVRPAH